MRIYKVLKFLYSAVKICLLIFATSVIVGLPVFGTLMIEDKDRLDTKTQLFGINLNTLYQLGFWGEISVIIGGILGIVCNIVLIWGFAAGLAGQREKNSQFFNRVENVVISAIIGGFDQKDGFSRALEVLIILFGITLLLGFLTY